MGTPLGRVPVKVKRLNGRVVDAAPEYEAARSIALEKRVPLRRVMELAVRAAMDLVEDADRTGKSAQRCTLCCGPGGATGSAADL